MSYIQTQLDKYQQSINNTIALLQSYPSLDQVETHVSVGQDGTYLYFSPAQAARLGSIVGRDGWTALKEHYSPTWNWHKKFDGVTLVLYNMDHTEEVNERPVLPQQFPIQIEDQ